MAGGEGSKPCTTQASRTEPQRGGLATMAGGRLRSKALSLRWVRGFEPSNYKYNYNYYYYET